VRGTYSNRTTEVLCNLARKTKIPLQTLNSIIASAREEGTGIEIVIGATIIPIANTQLSFQTGGKVEEVRGRLCRGGVLVGEILGCGKAVGAVAESSFVAGQVGWLVGCVSFAERRRSEEAE
jgi:hypothetical protein